MPYDILVKTNCGQGFLEAMSWSIEKCTVLPRIMKELLILRHNTSEVIIKQ